MISSLAGDEDNYLVKIMVMIGKFLFRLIFDMKEMEIFVKISGFLCLTELF